jgi:diguanylate cyclase (GGDEF)-like protein
MSKPKHLQDGLERTIDVGRKARRDFLLIAIIVVVACVAVLSDPDKVFEWVAHHKEVQVDEFLVAVVFIGTGFALFSWRRWTDLSRQVAEYKRLQTELTEINREASALSETDDLLQSCLSSEEAYNAVIRHIRSQLPGSSGAICVISNSRDLVETVAQWGDPSLAEHFFAPKDCWGLRRGRVTILSSADSQMACAHIGPDRPHYAMCVPMMAQGETLGVLYLDSGRVIGKQPDTKLAALSESQERMVKTLAEHLALAVANLNLREKLRMQSIRDPLTDLFNRRYMEESLERELRRSTRKKLPLAVMMIDVDHFKRFNDSFGHEAGDALLCELARLFRAQLRAEDIPCRYGGEEFALILPEAPLEAARERAEQLRRIANESHIQHRGNTLERVSISIGVSCYPQHGSTGEDLLRSADQALYRAKEEGRDRVVVA